VLKERKVPKRSGFESKVRNPVPQTPQSPSLPNTHLLLWNPPELFAREKGLRGHVIVHPGAETWNPTADSYHINQEVAPIECAAGSERQETRI